MEDSIWIGRIPGSNDYVSLTLGGHVVQTLKVNLASHEVTSYRQYVSEDLTWQDHKDLWSVAGYVNDVCTVVGHDKALAT